MDRAFTLSHDTSEWRVGEKLAHWLALQVLLLLKTTRISDDVQGKVYGKTLEVIAESEEVNAGTHGESDCI